MLTYLYASLLLVATAQADLDWITNDGGRWLPVVVYPNLYFEPMCHLHIATKSSVECICGEKSNVPVLNLKNVERNRTDSYAVSIVLSADDITPVLASKCKCDGKETEPMAIQKLNENTFAAFETDKGLADYFGPSEPNLATVFVKNVPKLKELRDLILNFDHLKTRKPGLVCEPDMFNNATSS